MQLGQLQRVRIKEEFKKLSGNICTVKERPKDSKDEVA